MGFDMEELKKIHEEAKKESSGGDFQGKDKYWKAKEGINIIRICPPAEGKTIPLSFGKKHFKLGTDGRGTVVCRKVLGNKEPCPACDKVFTMFKSDDESTIKIARKQKATDVYSYNIVDRLGDPNKILIYSPPAGKTEDSVNNRILSLLADYGEKLCTPSDDGLDIMVVRRGTGFKDTTYPEVNIYGIKVYECLKCGATRDVRPEELEIKEEDGEEETEIMCENQECGSKMVLNSINYKKAERTLGVENYEENLWDLSAEFEVPTVEEIEYIMKTSLEERKEKSQKEYREKQAVKDEPKPVPEKDNNVDEEIKKRLEKLRTEKDES